MQSRTYSSDSLSEGAHILSREWSRHELAVSRGDALRLRFSIRDITPHMSLSALAYGVPVTVRPQDRAEVLLLQMPRTGNGVASYPGGNAPMDPAHYALIDVPRVAQVHYSRDLDVLVLRITQSRLMAQLEELLGHRPADALRFEPGIARGSVAWAAWEPVSAALDAVQRSSLTDFPAPAMVAMERMVLSTLLLAQPHNHSAALLMPAPQIAPRHVRRAEEFIHANLARAPGTEEIARHAQVSVRALFDGFQTFRQTTPAAYVRAARLGAVRAELQRSSDGVADIARRWGFQHAGHFAAQYRRQFGEAPAATRRTLSPLH